MLLSDNGMSYMTRCLLRSDVRNNFTKVEAGRAITEAGYVVRNLLLVQWVIRGLVSLHVAATSTEITCSSSSYATFCEHNAEELI